jgi:predicted Zn-dependent protease
MYLPLAAVLALVIVVASRRILGRVAALGILLPLLAVLGLVSASRIRDYETALSIWRDATAKSPNSMLARNQYSRALFEAGRVDEALEQSRESLRVVPDKNPIAQQNAGALLVAKQKPAEALPYLEESVRLRPDRAKAHFVLGRALSSLGRSREAAEHYRRAFALEPGDMEACGALAMSLARAGAAHDGLAQMEECLRRWPQDARLRNNLASLLIQGDRPAEALAQLAESVRLDPGYALGRFNLSVGLLQTGRVEEGVRELVRAYRDAGADEALRRRILGRARTLAGPARSVLEETVRSSQDPALDVLVER